MRGRASEIFLPFLHQASFGIGGPISLNVIVQIDIRINFATLKLLSACMVTEKLCLFSLQIIEDSPASFFVVDWI